MPDREPSLLLTARMTHVAGLASVLGVPGSERLLAHGIRSLETAFADEAEGGWFGTLAREGRKTAYEHVHVVLAAASAVTAQRAGADVRGAEELARRATEVVERRFWREDEGALCESFDAELGRPGALSRRERQHARGRGLPRHRRRTRRGRLAPAGAADLRADRPPPRARPGLAAAGALRRRVARAARLQHRQPQRPVPALRRDVRPLAGVGPAALRAARVAARRDARAGSSSPRPRCPAARSAPGASTGARGSSTPSTGTRSRSRPCGCTGRSARGSRRRRCSVG